MVAQLPIQLWGRSAQRECYDCLASSTSGMMGLYMRGFWRRRGLCAVCLMGLALLSPVAAQSPVDQQTAGGTANIYNLDRDAHVGRVEIQGPIDRALTSQAIELIRSIRPDVDELTVLLN